MEIVRTAEADTAETPGAAEQRDLSRALDPRLGKPEWLDNWTIGPGLRFEFLDREGRVWLCQQSVTREQARGLALPDGATPALMGEAIADLSFFTRSPDASADGPLDTMQVDGLTFSFVARPGRRRRAGHGVADGAAILSVDKHHTLLFSGGRSIEVLDFGDGTFAPPAWAGPGPRIAPVEHGWDRREVELTSDLIVAIPCPADVVIFGDGFGFHGPLPISRLERACR